MKTHKLGIRFLRCFIVLALCLSLLPAAAMAEEGGSEPTIPVTGIEIMETFVELNVGEEAEVNLQFEPRNATNRKVTWSSSDDSVVRVNAEGKITAYSAGVATITVTTEDGGFTDTSEMRVGMPDTPMKTYKRVSSLSVGKNYLIGCPVGDSNVRLLKVEEGSLDAPWRKLKEDGETIALEDPDYLWTVTAGSNTAFEIKHGSVYLTDENGLKLTNEYTAASPWNWNGMILTTGKNGETHYLRYNAEEGTFVADTISGGIFFFEEQEMPQLKGISAELGGEIGFHYYVSIPSALQGGVMNFDIISSTGDGPVRRNHNVQGTKKEDGRWDFVCPVATIEIGDMILASYSVNDVDYPMKGEIESGTGAEGSGAISVLKYLNKLISSGNDPHHLAAALKDYGHYAQLALAAGANHTEIESAGLTLPEKIEGYDLELDLEGNTVSVSFSLDLESKTTMNYYVTMNGEQGGMKVGPMSGFNDGNWKLSIIGTDRFRFSSIGVGANKLAEPLTLTFYEDRNEYSIKGSALSYAQRCLANPSTRPELKDACKALYNYAMAAKAADNSGQ